MSQRGSGYARKDNDKYETPAWVTLALGPHLPIERVCHVTEPCAASGMMIRALQFLGCRVEGTDIATGVDFLTVERCDADAIITNPPYGRADEFIEHALKLTAPMDGMVAMLLRADFDSAKTRRHLFADCAQFSKKLVLTKRIVWFDGPGAAPSYNHCWYLWDWQHKGAPTIAYHFGEVTP